MRSVNKMAKVLTARLGRRLKGQQLCLFQFIYASHAQARIPNRVGQGQSLRVSL